MCNQVVYDRGVYVCADTGEVLGVEYTSTLKSEDLAPAPYLFFHDYGFGSEPETRHVTLKKVFKLLIKTGLSMGFSWSVIKEAAYVIRRMRSTGVSKRKLVIGALCVAANSVLGYDPHFFAHVLSEKLSISANVYQVSKLCKWASELSGVRLKNPDPRHVLAQCLPALDIPVELKGGVARRALEIYHLARPFVHCTTRVLVAACVYIACKELGVPAMYGDLMRAFHVSDSPVCNAKNKVVRLLNLGKAVAGKKTT